MSLTWPKIAAFVIKPAVENTKARASLPSAYAVLSAPCCILSCAYRPWWQFNRQSQGSTLHERPHQRLTDHLSMYAKLVANHQFIHNVTRDGIQTNSNTRLAGRLRVRQQARTSEEHQKMIHAQHRFVRPCIWNGQPDAKGNSCGRRLLERAERARGGGLTNGHLG